MAEQRICVTLKRPDADVVLQRDGVQTSPSAVILLSWRWRILTFLFNWHCRHVFTDSKHQRFVSRLCWGTFLYCRATGDVGLFLVPLSQQWRWRCCSSLSNICLCLKLPGLLYIDISLGCKSTRPWCCSDVWRTAGQVKFTRQSHWSWSFLHIPRLPVPAGMFWCDSRKHQCAPGTGCAFNEKRSWSSHLCKYWTAVGVESSSSSVYIFAYWMHWCHFLLLLHHQTSSTSGSFVCTGVCTERTVVYFLPSSSFSHIWGFKGYKHSSWVMCAAVLLQQELTQTQQLIFCFYLF